MLRYLSILLCTITLNSSLPLRAAQADSTPDLSKVLSDFTRSKEPQDDDDTEAQWCHYLATLLSAHAFIRSSWSAVWGHELPRDPVVKRPELYDLVLDLNVSMKSPWLIGKVAVSDAVGVFAGRLKLPEDFLDRLEAEVTKQIFQPLQLDTEAMIKLAFTRGAVVQPIAWQIGVGATFGKKYRGAEDLVYAELRKKASTVWPEIYALASAELSKYSLSEADLNVARWSEAAKENGFFKPFLQAITAAKPKQPESPSSPFGLWF